MVTTARFVFDSIKYSPRDCVVLRDGPSKGKDYVDTTSCTDCERYYLE